MRVHATAIIDGQPREDRARCGWLLVETTTDLSRVTCRVCRKRCEGGTVAAPRRSRPPLASHLGEGLREALLQVAVVPTASSPPVFDPESWRELCRVDSETQRRCGSCVLCEYERELVRYAALDPYRVRARQPSGVDDPVFGSLNGALVALAEWRLHDRHAPSAFGEMLDRLRMGQTGGPAPSVRSESHLLDRASDVADVDQAVRRAFEVDNAAHLPPLLAEALLLVRTPGVVRGGAPTYVELAARFEQGNHAVTARQLKRTVRLGRRAVTVDLAARGLIRQPSRSSGLAEAIEQRQLALVAHNGGVDACRATTNEC